MDQPTPRISMAGTSAVLFDVAGDIFSEESQDRIHALARLLRETGGVRETVPGMNNMLVTFDPLSADPEAVEEALAALWPRAEPDPLIGRDCVVPVRYGGAAGPDLAEFAQWAGMSPRDLVERHAEATYRVAAVGAMPGFVYLSGLAPELSRPRRATPRGGVPVGSVMIGGAQAGIMPCTAPSGWHILGRTEMALFDPALDPPAAFQPGDRIRFVPESVEP
ncbi:MAG: allophanate hydrolase [Mesorhizobium amorphae]|nr:MAG: allophanate hydrolase [Mesorhizobium amorphae]